MTPEDIKFLHSVMRKHESGDSAGVEVSIRRLLELVSAHRKKEACSDYRVFVWGGKWAKGHYEGHLYEWDYIDSGTIDYCMGVASTQDAYTVIATNEVVVWPESAYLSGLQMTPEEMGLCD
jgi:hypothetical protein